MTIFVTGAHGTALVVRTLTAAVSADDPASRAARALAVDLSPSAGGLDIVFGVEHRPGWRWADIVAAEGDIDLDLLLARLPAADQPAGDGLKVLSHGRQPMVVPAALRAAVVAAARAHPVPTVVEVQDPVLLRELVCPGDRVIVTGELDARDLGAMMTVLRALPVAFPVSVLAYAARGDAALRVDEAIDADVEFVRRDRRAERALEHGLPAPGRGPMASWARSWLACGEVTA